MSIVLFSPVGSTDPIRNMHDGSLLHIIRHYRPDRILLFMSKEIHARHLHDDRYRYCIEQLAAEQGTHPSVEVIARDDLVNVQSYDVFYGEFKKILTQIAGTLGDQDELLVNIASGTPAMKSALVLLSQLGEVRFRAIQVSTPLGRSNFTDEDVDHYDAAEQWECNEDNAATALNRCEEVKSANLMLLLQIETIKKHLLAYNYSAAYMLAKDIAARLKPEGGLCIEMAFARQNLDYGRVLKLARETGYMPIPVKKDEDRIVVEYLLDLQNKVRRHTFDDFVRGISPVLMELMDRALKSDCRINYKDYCVTTKNGSLKWNSTKLANTKIMEALIADDPSFNGYETVYTRHLKTLITAFSVNKEQKQLAEKLRAVEESARNKAAHTMVSITSDMIKMWTDYTGEQIMEMLRNMAVSVHLVTKEAAPAVWRSYDEMNEMLISILDKSII